MNLLILTNARTGARLAINPASIATLEERTDEKYPNTKVALVKTDGTFTPIKEDIDTCINKLMAASRGMQQQTPVRQQASSPTRPMEMSDEEIAGLDPR